MGEQVETPFAIIKVGIGNIKEKTSTWVRYKTLKVKEYFGRLNQEEFDELLSRDFQEELKDNLPIEGVFSPEEELVKIRHLPKEHKKTALATFKEKLARQREAWATCRVFIERTIEFNHDVSEYTLRNLVEKFGTHYSFTEQQKQIAKTLIEEYKSTRQRVLEMRRRYPNNTALVNELTGMTFGETVKFDVSVGPMSIDMLTDGFNAGRIFQSSKDITVKLPYAGFATTSMHEKPIPFIVINKDTIYNKLGINIAPHEYEHIKNKLFRKIFDRQVHWTEKDTAFWRYEDEQDPETKTGLLEAYLRLMRQEGLNHAKDEILAIKLGEKYEKTLGGLLEVGEDYSIFFQQDNSAYDYLASIRNWGREKNDQLYQSAAQKILVEEYRNIIEEALDAFDMLEKQGRYKREEVIAMLTDKSLEQWPKTVRRMLEQKQPDLLR